MRRLIARGSGNNRGVAAIEFALILPVLLLMLGGLTDFSLIVWTKGILANSVTNGAIYAFTTGIDVTAAAIRSVVGQQLALPEATVVVTGPSCSCISGAPATAVGQTCGQPCPTGAVAGSYVTILVTYPYNPVMPFYSGLANTVLAESTMVRLR